MKICTIIPAAGSGKRFGEKKQFYNLCGKPIISWTMAKFYDISENVILLVPKENVSQTKSLLFKIHPDYKKLTILSGGKHRYDTVKIGLKHIPQNCELVCIHDAVRPLVSIETIKNCIKQAKVYGAAIVAVPSKDTVKISGKKEFVSATILRDIVWLVQTPQIFKKDILLKAYNKISNYKNITDDSQVVERAGYKVKLVKGVYTNIKITEKQDVQIAELFMLPRK